MKIKSKYLTFSLLLIIGFIITPLLSQSLVPNSSQTTTITFWYTENDVEKPGLLAKVAAFEAANPDIDVVPLQKGFFDAENDYRVAFVAGEEPELFRAGRDTVTRFASEGLIANLTDHFSTADLADFLEISISLMTYPDENGVDQIWGFPQAVDNPSFLFNKHYFDAVGINTSEILFNSSWSWDEYSGYLPLLNTTTDVYATTLAGMFFGAQPFYYGKGAYFFEDGIYDMEHVAINSTESRAALTFLKNITDSAYTPRWEEQGWANYANDFAAGEIALIAAGPWEITNFLQNSIEFNTTATGAKAYASPDNLGVMQLPYDNDGNYGALVGGNYYVVSSYATGDEYDAAVALAQFLSNHNSMAISAIDYYHVPARLSVMQNATVMAADSYPFVQGFFEQAKNAFSLPPSEYYGSLEGDFGNKVDEYLAGDITLDVCISETLALWADTLEPDEEPEPEPEIPGYTIPIILFASALGIIFAIRKKNH